MQGIERKGKRYGSLVCIEICGRTPGRNLIWKCQCDCGNISLVSTGSLIGGTKSCGCHNHDQLEGQRFGRLTVIKFNGSVDRVNKRKGDATWLCNCDCGGTKIVNTSHLKGGSISSCGCKHKENSILQLAKLAAKTGPEHHRYDHSLSDEDRRPRQLHTKEYRGWRTSVYHKDKYICVVCKERNRSDTSGDLQAHHIYSWNSDEAGRFATDNGITMCKKCHTTFHQMFGSGNNTREQLERFIALYDNEFCLDMR